MKLVGFHSLAVNQPIVGNHLFTHHNMDISPTCGSQDSLTLFYWDYNYWPHVNLYILFAEILLSFFSSNSSIVKKRIYSSWHMRVPSHTPLLKGHASYPNIHTTRMFRCGFYLGCLTNGIPLSTKFLVLSSSKLYSVSKTKGIHTNIPKTKLLSHDHHIGCTIAAYKGV